MEKDKANVICLFIIMLDPVVWKFPPYPNQLLDSLPSNSAHLLFKSGFNL